MMKKACIYSVIACACFMLLAWPAAGAAKFRVVGYLRYNDKLLTDAKALAFDKITHLNIAFVNPDSAGNFKVSPQLAQVAALAHHHGLKILASIAGGNPPAYFSKLLAQGRQAAFIAGLTALAVNNNLDGIDVDIEQSLINADYEAFVTGLAAALHARHKMITAAIATMYRDSYTDKALQQFDFINIMSYDKTGPWKPERPGPHAPYQMAADDLTYWTTVRSIAQEKLNLGLPFYGYGFGRNAPAEIIFRDIIAQYPQAQSLDEIAVPGGGIIYYNGIPTIRAKTRLALSAAGGIMIWELSQDADGSSSLLKVVDEAIKLQGR